MVMLKKFPDIRRFAWNSVKQQKWNTTVQRSASGKVRTMTNQLYPEWTITATLPAITDEEARVLLGFVAGLKGAYEPFLWLDPEDYKAKGVGLPLVDNYYQAVILMGAYGEPAEYIEDVAVYVDKVKQPASSYTVTNGTIVFTKPPAPTAKVTADYTYYWKVMLADDGLTINKIFADVNKCDLKMVVAR